jgi:hypothetical protein
VRYALIGALILNPVRAALVATRLHGWLWHPLLAEAAIYISIVATLNILF